MSSDYAICFRCGNRFGKRKGYFSVSYSTLTKGVGYLPYCRTCVDTIYNTYLSQCDDSEMALRQTCRTLNLYWSESVYKMVANKSSNYSIMSQYITRLNNTRYVGKSYDDTLSDEGTLWNFGDHGNTVSQVAESAINNDNTESIDRFDLTGIPQDVIDFWGAGQTRDMYEALEQRKKYYMENYEGVFSIANGDIGSDILMKQVCNLEVTIARDAAAGKAIDKSVNSLNTIIGSLNLKPAQKKDDSDNIFEKNPYGVWVQRFEYYKPIPEPDPEFEDVDGIIKYILTWVYGHTTKMLNVKNSFCKLYEKAMEKLRVKHPEYDDEEDDDFLYDVFGGDDDDE